MSFLPSLFMIEKIWSFQCDKDTIISVSNNGRNDMEVDGNTDLEDAYLQAILIMVKNLHSGIVELQQENSACPSQFGPFSSKIIRGLFQN